MITLTAGIGALVLGITEASAWHWADPRTVASLVGGVILLAVTLYRSSTHAVPVLEIDLWKSRTFARANVASFFYGTALYAWLLVGVLYLTQAWGYTELQAGLALSPGAVLAAIVATGVGRWRNANAPRLAVVGGALMIAGVGLWVGIILPAHPHFLTVWLPAALISAFGMGAITTGRLKFRRAVSAADAIREWHRPQPDRQANWRRIRHRHRGRNRPLRDRPRNRAL